MKILFCKNKKCSFRYFILKIRALLLVQQIKLQGFRINPKGCHFVSSLLFSTRLVSRICKYQGLTQYKDRLCKSPSYDTTPYGHLLALSAICTVLVRLISSYPPIRFRNSSTVILGPPISLSSLPEQCEIDLRHPSRSILAFICALFINKVFFLCTRNRLVADPSADS